MSADPMLLTPLQVGPVELPNRLVFASHVSGLFPWTPMGPDQYIEYQRRRAASGTGMIVTEAVWLSGIGSDAIDGLADAFGRYADAIRAEGTGTKTILQIASFGAEFWSLLVQPGAGPLHSFNGMQSPTTGEPTHRMSAGEIERLVELHAHTARVATENGIDGVELQGAHGYLIHQSMSPWGNGRDDAWGEPLAFARATIDAVREAIGPDKALGFRMAADDGRPAAEGGRSAEQLAAQAKQLVDGGGIDFLNLGMGSRAPEYTAQTARSYRAPLGGDLPLAAGMRRALGGAIPVVGIGRILTPEQGEAALQRGDCDLVAMTRAQMADAQAIAKFRRGESRRIRPCVGANECGAQLVPGIGRLCFHNPGMGRPDEDVLEPVAQRKRVVVVGAGPAGLKAAELAARRGHEVIVADALEEPGGTLRHVRATAARELFGAVDWLVGELRELGVELRLGTRLDGDALLALAPDEVVLATGARRAAAGAVAGDARVLTSIEALDASVDGDVVVLDRLGDVEACLVAEALVGRGARVTFVTPHETFAPRAGFTQTLDVKPILRDAGCEILTETDVAHGAGRTLRLVDRGGRPRGELTADALVAVTAPAPDTELVPALERAGIPHRIVGDALAPLGVSSAMRDANAAARAL